MVKPKKHLGQHFLIDLSVSQRIAEAALSRKERCECVLEIGPGTGALTQFLTGNDIPVVAFEVDRESIDYLNNVVNLKGLSVLEQDFLKSKLSDLPQNIGLTGNFPYNISSQIVFHMLDNMGRFPFMVGMFQKEVAERIASSHGSKVYGIQSVLSQFYYKAEYLFTVSEGVFNPPPKVKSGVIALDRLDTPLLQKANYSFAKQIVKVAFNQRRKMLRVSLKQFKMLFRDDDDWKTLRPEQLSVQDFAELVDTLYQRKLDLEG